MKIIISLTISISFLFPINGKIIFNDGTIIKGKVNTVNSTAASITPEGLSFPEQIMISNIDTLKSDDGKLLIASNKILLYFENGEFSDPNEIKENNKKNIKETFEIEYVIVPNWSANIYTGYPIPGIRGNSFNYYDKIYPTFGLSIGSPYGIFIGDFFMNIIGELAYYRFRKSANENLSKEEQQDTFEGFGYQVGLSPGLFIGDLSISMTAATGVYHAGPGLITGGSIDLPVGSYLVNKFRNNTLVEKYEDYLLSIEMRITSRANILKKNDGLTTYWLGGGVSFGYEF